MQEEGKQVAADKHHTVLEDPDTAAKVHHAGGTAGVGMPAEVGVRMPAELEEGSHEVQGGMDAEAEESNGEPADGTVGAWAVEGTHHTEEVDSRLEACVGAAGDGTVAALSMTCKDCTQ